MKTTDIEAFHIIETEKSINNFTGCRTKFSALRLKNLPVKFSIVSTLQIRHLRKNHIRIDKKNCDIGFDLRNFLHIFNIEQECNWTGIEVFCFI
ncbi:uncharacterized protein LOC129958322 [Argiope bruennichi]|uniref:uncharacterized protein LOC129958322 n=1 Tax=Argiope bruennichi TaxID=94029 RepID=UPI0024952012|nr:uncharacterized protein LOC129958322 [Argiope bruennichi]XP_055926696.1 uncharacterized protein LOC129958322 [Argiope bruennichi]XP_055926697.1 uncharacterized protein LOC129958322 [Argiope bruennichi]